MRYTYHAAICAMLLSLSLAGVAGDGRPGERVNLAPAVNRKAVVWRGPVMPKAGQTKSGDIWINPVDGSELVFIEEGGFYMGSNDVPDEGPRRHLRLGSYWIGRYEVTVAQYRKFCAATSRKMPQVPAVGWLDTTPIVNVDWNEAAAYAKWANGRLPYEAEWEKAARGWKGAAFSWGNGWDKRLCNNGVGGENAPMPVGSYPAGASPYGVMDTTGNAGEWCADKIEKPADPMDYRVLRGGTCKGNDIGLFRSSARDNLPPSAKSPVIGFRIVLEAR